MLPPTAATLAQIAEHPDVPTLLRAAAQRDAGAPVSPRVVKAADGTLRLAVG
jgi:hypothetical protein